MASRDGAIGRALAFFDGDGFRDRLAALVAMERVRDMGARYVGASRQSSAELIGFLEERLSGLPDVQANGAAGYVVHRAEERLRALFRAARLHGNVDHRVAQVYAVVGAVVGGLDDVGAVLCEDSGELVQGPGIIG